MTNIFSLWFPATNPNTPVIYKYTRISLLLPKIVSSHGTCTGFVLIIAEAIFNKEAIGSSMEIECFFISRLGFRCSCYKINNICIK